MCFLCEMMEGKIRCVDDMAERIKVAVGESDDPRWDMLGRMVLVKAPRFYWDIVDKVIEKSSFPEQEIISMIFATGVAQVQRDRQRLKEQLKNISDRISEIIKADEN